MSDPVAARLGVPADRRLAERFRDLAGQRMVFFAGLPGTGKSLLVHQLVHLAGAAGRTVHLLQWDVARPVFEASPAGRHYPLADGVTHAVIRRAAGLWVRAAPVQPSAARAPPGRRNSLRRSPVHRPGSPPRRRRRGPTDGVVVPVRDRGTLAGGPALPRGPTRAPCR